MEESHQVKMQTAIGINIPSKKQRDEPSKPDSKPNENLTFRKVIDSSHQGGKASDTNSTLREEPHQKPGKSN